MSHASVAVGRGPGTESHPPLLFHSLVPAAHDGRRGRAGSTTALSVLAHLGLIAGVVVVPLLGYEAVPEHGATTFFAPPLQLRPAPPPPPPPPPGVRSPARPTPPTTRAADAALVAPIDIPTVILPEKDIGLGLSGGQPGGVPGGVPHGVVGAVVGGLPLSTAPPPPDLAPVRAGGKVRRPVKLRTVAPEYPAIARQARVEGVVILECTISRQGRVTGVRVLRGNPLLDNAALEAVRQWVYTPTLLNGVPVPVVMTVTVTFDLRGRS